MMRLALITGVLVVALATSLCVQAAERRTAMTLRGVAIQILEDVPTSSGPFPVVILAGGGGGDMTQPLLANLADSLVARGMAVVRFDWAYRTADPASGRQSDELAAEVEDMGAVLARVRKDPRLDAGRIVLMGKSLGSVVTLRLFDHDPAIRGAVLLTPICSLPQSLTRQPWQLDIYPAFSRQSRPMAMIAGDRDPVCAVSALYRMAAGAAGPVRVAVVGGDHGFSAGSRPADAEFSGRNIDLAIRNAADAAETMLATAPP